MERLRMVPVTFNFISPHIRACKTKVPAVPRVGEIVLRPDGESFYVKEVIYHIDGGKQCEIEVRLAKTTHLRHLSPVPEVSTRVRRHGSGHNSGLSRDTGL
jgi:hypothetical protein